MAKNERASEAGQPVWFDGKNINEALFCDEFLRKHKIIFTNGAFFTPEGRVTDELPLRGAIFEELILFRGPWSARSGTPGICLKPSVMETSR